jgi:hypothetical protein
VDDQDILLNWWKAIESWAHGTAPSKPVAPLLSQIFSYVLSFDIEPNKFEEYLHLSTKNGEIDLSLIRGQLWRIGMLPDKQALNAGVAAKRIRMNRDTINFLTTISESNADANRLYRIQHAAESGDTQSQKLFEFSKTKDPSYLCDLDLDDVISIMYPKSVRHDVDGSGNDVTGQANDEEGGDPPPEQPKQVNILDYLDDEVSQQQKQSALEALDREWRGVSDEQGATVAEPGSTRFDIVVPEYESSTFTWFAGEDYESQAVMAFVPGEIPKTLEHAHIRNWLRGSDLMQAAGQQDFANQSTYFVPLVQDYLTTRFNLAPYETALRGGPLELLLIKTDVREKVKAFLDAWRSLSGAIAGATESQSSEIRHVVGACETVWGSSTGNEEDYEWAILGSFHPYILEPVIQLAEYALQRLGEVDLGSRLKWACENCIPAYRLIWNPIDARRLFLLSTGSVAGYRYSVFPRTFAPSADTGDGVSRIVRAFRGFHPYAEEQTVVNFVNPPRGSALRRNLETLDRQGPVRVNVARTRQDSPSSLEDDSNCVYQGRYRDLLDYARKGQNPAHITFIFEETTESGDTPPTTLQGPTPGTHVSLQVKLNRKKLLSSEKVPWMTLKPRKDNQAVHLLQKIPMPGSDPNVFEFKAEYLSGQSIPFDALRENTDWVVLAVPGAISRIPPKDLSAHRLFYLGKETVGPYALFVYTSDRFSIRKFFNDSVTEAPVTTSTTEMEERLDEIATSSPQGVLRLGIRKENAVWEQVANLVADYVGRGL